MSRYIHGDGKPAMQRIHVEYRLMCCKICCQQRKSCRPTSAHMRLHLLMLKHERHVLNRHWDCLLSKGKEHVRPYWLSNFCVYAFPKGTCIYKAASCGSSSEASLPKLLDRLLNDCNSLSAQHNNCLSPDQLRSTSRVWTQSSQTQYNKTTD